MAPRADLKFEAPGPGSWILDNTHFPMPMTRFIAEILPPTFGTAMTEVFPIWMLCSRSPKTLAWMGGMTTTVSTS